MICIACQTTSVSSGHLLCPCCHLFTDVEIDQRSGRVSVQPRNLIPAHLLMAPLSALRSAGEPVAVSPIQPALPAA